MKRSLIALACASYCFSPAFAQTTVATSPTQVPTSTGALTIGAPQANVLRAGTEVPLVMTEDLTTKGKKLRVGQRIHLKVSEDVKLNGQTVIPAGTPAVGELTDVRNKGMWGKSGHIGAQLLYLEVNGRQIRLSGQFDDKGVTGTAGVVAAIAFVPVAGFFTTGTSAHIPVGGAVKGFIDEDVPVAFATVTPAPMVVPVRAASSTAAAPAQATAAPLANPPAPVGAAVVAPAAAAKTAS